MLNFQDYKKAFEPGMAIQIRNFSADSADFRNEFFISTYLIVGK